MLVAPRGVCGGKQRRGGYRRMDTCGPPGVVAASPRLGTIPRRCHSVISRNGYHARRRCPRADGFVLGDCPFERRSMDRDARRSSCRRTARTRSPSRAGGFGFLAWAPERGFVRRKRYRWTVARRAHSARRVSDRARWTSPVCAPELATRWPTSLGSSLSMGWDSITRIHRGEWDDCGYSAPRSSWTRRISARMVFTR
jgi:hypothetical protein